MAAFETPWLQEMSSPQKGSDPASPRVFQDQNPSTVAPFSPSQTPTKGQQRSSVLVQRKSPLLIATPPEVTRALAFSHPFLLPLNKFVGLISWSSGDPWESFLVIGAFWALTIYGGAIIRWAGPIVVVVLLILGMYSRRYSPLSSTGLSGEKVKGQKRDDPAALVRHQKSLDEIVDTMNIFVARCNILLDPLLDLTDFLSTQRTATSATTRPALTTLFIRILMITPIWVVLTLPPIRIITTQRVILAVGTFMLSWHSRPARVTRTILWRSLTVRYILSVLTGLGFMQSSTGTIFPPPLPPRNKSQQDIASSLSTSGRSASVGVRFTFTVYENQRRWLGLGWTSSLFAYERAAWTDEHLSPSQSKEDFSLPIMENDKSRWQWVPGSDWHIEGVPKSAASGGSKSSNDGWIYYDNKWNDGRRQDGWGRYTRRRKWYRDAELVDNTQDTETLPTELPASEAKGSSVASSQTSTLVGGNPGSPTSNKDIGDTGGTLNKRRGFFRRNSRTSAQSSVQSNRTLFASDDEQDHSMVSDTTEQAGDWNVGDEIKMGLG
ncbi:peroxisome- protein [Xylographa trunciseda]|nr:peroxisome- protein [Xylographa trunciseda]